MDPFIDHELTDNVIAQFEGTRDERLRQITTSLVMHLHDFVRENNITLEEWRAGIDFLTRTGQKSDDKRQEFILLSDVFGVSMLVDAMNHAGEGTTESTVLGPFYVPGSPQRPYGASIAEEAAGTPAWIHGRVLDLSGGPIEGAELDVWQNGDDRLYAVQNPEAPEDHLRGRFTARDDGSYAFLAVRPVPYTIPADGPVGKMLAATGRHPWRPAHIHMIVRAPGYRTLATHIFDGDSEYLEADAVFAVKPSLLREFVPRSAEDPGRPDAVEGQWFSVENTIVLAPSDEPSEPVDPGRTA
jgi:hydroxyquinol 1,2-dioxygenase